MSKTAHYEMKEAFNFVLNFDYLLYPILNSAINTMKVRIFDKGFEHNFSSWRIPGPNLEN